MEVISIVNRQPITHRRNQEPAHARVLVLDEDEITFTPGPVTLEIIDQPGGPSAEVDGQVVRPVEIGRHVVRVTGPSGKRMDVPFVCIEPAALARIPTGRAPGGAMRDPRAILRALATDPSGERFDGTAASLDGINLSTYGA